MSESRPGDGAGNVFFRAVVVSVCLLAGAAILARSSRAEIVPPRVSLAEFPMTLDGWRGRVEADFTQDILDVLGVDEYVNRSYFRQGTPPVGVYIGYYGSQRQGDTMHSPLNCLPGAGWIPVRQNRIRVPVQDGNGSREIEINSFVIEKGLDRQAVLYWYQSVGRVVASEYWGKIHMVTDAIRYNRTDGALVRVIVPIGPGDEAMAAAERTGVEFVRTMFPVLSNHLPS